MKIFILTFLVLVSPYSNALQIYKTGNPIDVQPRVQPATCLIGGGDFDSWAAGWKYMMNKSNHGDVVVIRIDGERGEYEDWIYNDSGHNNLPKVNSVTVLSIENPEDANDSRLVEVLKKAELIFFVGGDQSIYIDWFRDSLLENEVNWAIHYRKIPIGGTSAGMAFLSGIDFSAHFDSPSTGGMITSEDALMNPTADYLDLDKRVVTAPFMNNIVTETHFTVRHREGRMMGFLAKALYSNLSSLESLRGIAADQDTALCYDDLGNAHVVGSGEVFLFRPLSTPEILEPLRPLTWNRNGKAVEVITLDKDHGQFNISNWKKIKPDENSIVQRFVNRQFWSVENGRLTKDFR